MIPNDPTDLSAQEAAQAQLGERVALRHQVEAGDIRWVMSNKRGRRFVFRTLERAGVWRLSFNTNAMTMAFQEGERNGGLKLLAQITTHCPERYEEMLKEAKE